MTTDPRCTGTTTCDWYQEFFLFGLDIAATVRCRYTVCGIDGGCAELFHRRLGAGSAGGRPERVLAGVLQCQTKDYMRIAAYYK